MGSKIERWRAAPAGLTERQRKFKYQSELSAHHMLRYGGENVQSVSFLYGTNLLPGCSLAQERCWLGNNYERRGNTLQARDAPPGLSEVGKILYQY